VEMQFFMRIYEYLQSMHTLFNVGVLLVDVGLNYSSGLENSAVSVGNSLLFYSALVDSVPFVNKLG
jgi:uncharacterized transporter YbjL